MATQRKRKANFSEAEKAAALDLLTACDGNIREAARRFGVTESTLRQWASGTCVSADVYAHYAQFSRARVAQRVAALHATADEVLSVLALHLRADFADLSDCLRDNGTLDLAAAQRKGISRLVKKLKTRATPLRRGDEVVYEHTTEIEIYDAQAAAAKLANLLGITKQPDDNPNKLEREGIAAELRAKAEALLAQYTAEYGAERGRKLLLADAPRVAGLITESPLVQ